ncbi:DMT family transporter [candidate division KSB1 bacterium]|nr:DMT family transporter [candidate division KSB1 bacterium]
MKSKPWLFYALITTSFWGVWGALITITEKAGFPATLGYTVWSLTMILPALVALKLVNWKLDYDKKSILWGAIIGFTGAGGQMILFTKALSLGPAYLIFPIISLSPVVTILLSKFLLNEKASKLGWIGIFLALAAIPLLSYADPSQSASQGNLWLIFALLVFFGWGVQGYFMRFANQTMKAESIFFYMMVTGILLAPIALFLTDFSQPINWGFEGPYLAYLIQTLNSVGALCIVYAFRYGKAIIVSPMTNAVAPIITVVLSLILYQKVPHYIIVMGIVLAIIAAFLMALEDDSESVDRSLMP